MHIEINEPERAAMQQAHRNHGNGAKENGAGTWQKL